MIGPTVSRIALTLATSAGLAIGVPAPGSAARAIEAARAAPATSHAERDTMDLGATAKARVLHRWAEEAMTDPAIESRRRAERDLREAIRLDPTNADHWMTLGQVYLLGEYAKQGRECFDHAVLLAPRDPRTHMERGRAWKRDWTRWLDTLAFDHALADFDTVTQLRPNGSAGWLALTPMLYESGDIAGAARAAERALAGRPRVPEAGIAAAYTAWRRGDGERADSLFREFIPRLQPDLRRLFENAAPVLGQGAGAPERPRPARPVTTAQGSISGAPPAEQAPALGDSALAPPTPPEVWAGVDPDPTTPENETRLEYWSRVAHAYFVFWDPLEPVLDSRADLYIRYGPPRSIEINPPGVPLSFKPNVISSGRSTSLADYPMGVVRWNYPDLGMRVVLDDRSLHGRFDRAVTRDFEFGSTPNPAIMSRRGDLMTLDGGRAVFPTLPARNVRIEVAGLAARFESATGPRLFAQVQAIAPPADTLAARWVVLDTAGHEVARGGGRLTVSACEPSSRQVAEVSRDLPAGHYQLALSVKSGHRKGLFRTALDVPAPDTGLGMSDVVLSCGDPTQLAGGQSVRLDANVESIVSGSSPLTVYFEVYRLAADKDGMAHFEVEYAVRRLSEAAAPGAKPKKREPVLLSSSMRPADQLAGVRRQYVRVPMNALTPGRYELEIRVRDLVSGTQVERTIAFDKE